MYNNISALQMNIDCYYCFYHIFNPFSLLRYHNQALNSTMDPTSFIDYLVLFVILLRLRDYYLKHILSAMPLDLHRNTPNQFK